MITVVDLNFKIGFEKFAGVSAKTLSKAIAKRIKNTKPGGAEERIQHEIAKGINPKIIEKGRASYIKETPVTGKMQSLGKREQYGRSQFDRELVSKIKSLFPGSSMNQQFREGFEKEAGIKHVALAGALALGSAGAKAGPDAAKTTMNALKKTPIGQTVTKKIKDVGEKVTSKIKEYTKVDSGMPDDLHQTIKSKASDLGAAAGPKGQAPKISLKDLGNVKLKYKDLDGTVGTKGVTARYNINKNTFIEAFNKGKNSGVHIGYNKAF